MSRLVPVAAPARRRWRSAAGRRVWPAALRPVRIAGVKASLATVAVALLALSACSGDDGGSTEDPDGTTPSTEAEAETELSSYATISDLNEDLAVGGIECALDYEGLVDEVRELSQCTIDGGLAILTIWYDDGLMNDFLAPEGAEPPVAVAYGEDWTVELNDPATAATVAEAAGGTTTDG